MRACVHDARACCVCLSLQSGDNVGEQNWVEQGLMSHQTHYRSYQKTQPTVLKHWRKRSPKDQVSIPLGLPHCTDNKQHICSMKKTQNTHRWTQLNLGYAQWNAPSVTKPNPENCTNCSSKCAYDCAQLSYTLQHRTVLIISLLTSRQTP